MVKDYVLKINDEDITFLVYDCVYIDYMDKHSSQHLIDCTIEAVNRGYNYRLDVDDGHCGVLIGATLPAGIYAVNQGIVAEDIILRDTTGDLGIDNRIDRSAILEFITEVVGLQVLKNYIVNNTVCIWNYSLDNYATPDSVG